MRFSSLSPHESVIKALMGTRGNVAAKVKRKVCKVWGVQNNIAIRRKTVLLEPVSNRGLFEGIPNFILRAEVSLDIPSQTQL